MPQMFYSYTGPATNGRTVNWLTFDEAQSLQKQEDDLKAQQAADVKLAPVVNRAVSDYAKQTGTAEQISTRPESVPPLFRNPQTSPVSKAFAELEANAEDTSELEAVSSQVPPQKNQMSAVQAAGTTPRPTSSMLGEDAEEVPTQPQGQLAGLLSDLPPEIAQPLLIEYHSGTMSPSKFLSEVKKAKKELLDLRREEELLKAKGEKRGYGTSSVGAALAFTEAHPELIAEGEAILDRLRGEGKYGESLLQNVSANLRTDVRQALRDLAALQGKTESAVRTLWETIPGEEVKSRVKAGATVQGKEDAEQAILSGTTIQGFEPIPGVRQTEKSVDNVKTVKPQMDALKRSIDDLVSEYEKNGWQPIGPKSANYESKARLAQLLSKETALFNLGVLNGPDLDILEQVVSNPGGFKSGVAMARYGKDNYGIRLRNVQDLVDYKINKFYESNGLRPVKQIPSGGNASPPAAQGGSTTPQNGLTGAPSVGQVEDGYVYIGGDPADPKSWTKAR